MEPDISRLFSGVIPIMKSLLVWATFHDSIEVVGLRSKMIFYL